MFRYLRRILGALESIAASTERIANYLQPSAGPASFTVVLTNAGKLDTGGTTMALNKAKATLSNTVNDDGTINLNIAFADAKGLSESYTSWPSQVALPSAAFGDASPGPSSLVYTPAASIVPSTDVPNALVCGTIGAGTPPSTPPPAGWGQNVDVQITIASGLAGQTAPQTVDAGTVTVTADAANPGSFVPVVQN